MFEIILISLLVAFIIYREWIYRRDVDKLLDRIMAKSFPEYAACVKTAGKLEPKSMSDREEYEAECKRTGTIPEKEET